jgi:hypothetical protein
MQQSELACRPLGVVQANQSVCRPPGSMQEKGLTRRPLASMQENELACCRVRASQIFLSPEQPPEPTLSLGADTRDLPYNRGEVTS